MSSHTVDSRGSVNAFVVCIIGALVLVGLFVVANGRFVTEYVRVADVAENAARLAGQSVVGIRSGEPRIDQSTARADALAYMGRQGVHGSVAVSGSGTVEVRARVDSPFPGLSFLRVGAGHITVVRRARTVDG